MATYTDSLGFNKGSAAHRARDNNKVGVTVVELNFADIIAARTAASATALAATDVIEVISVPAQSVVLSAGIEVTSVESTNTTATFDLGDGTVTTGFVSALASNALGSEAPAFALTEGTPNTLDNYAAGKYYGAADTLDVVLGTAAPTDAVIRVWALMADVSIPE